MKKVFLFLLLLSAVTVFGQQKAYSLKATLVGEKDIFAPGDMIKFKMTYTCPETHRMGGWYIMGYTKNLPASFPAALNVKVRGKDPNWQAVHFTTWKWFPKGKEKDVVEFSTKGWPEGDYQISVTTIFRNKVKSETKTDKYIGSDLVFTLEK